MRKHIIHNAQHRIVQRLRARYKEIHPIPVKGLYNYMCHYNCIEYLRVNNNTEYSIAEVIYIENNTPVLHYVVIDKDATYMEITLGWQAEYLEYFFIRIIDPNNYSNILKEFYRSLDDWTMEFIPWIVRKVFRIDRIL